MLAPIIEAIMLGLGAGVITDVMLLLLLSVFAVAIYLKKKNRGHGFTHYTPTLLTTLGILGTFAGIIAGLLAFDVNNIDSSIGGLLDGLKTAFITSLVGMTLSIAFKLMQNAGWLASPIADGIDEDDIGIAELYAVMQQQAAGVEALGRSIGGDDRDSLVSQMKLLRSDIKDQSTELKENSDKSVAALTSIFGKVKDQKEDFTQFQERLWRNLQDFADMMSKSATEQVINALKEVIADFNNKLTEQFGENFKQLNEAVLKLVDWQENYKLQLQQMSEQYAQGVTAITKTEESVTHISNESKVIPESMAKLQDVMSVNQHQLGELERHLEAFKDIRDKAVDALPEIRTHIDASVEGMKLAAESMATGMTESVGTLQKAIVTGTEDFVNNSEKVNASLQGTSDIISSTTDTVRQTLDDAVKDTNGILREMVADMKDESKKLNQEFKEAGNTSITEAERIRGDFERGMEAMRTNLAKTITDLAEQQKAESQRVLSGMSGYADNALRNTGEAVEKQVLALDKALQHEMNTVMNEMGRALASISGRFTSDYQRLTEQMQQITRSAAGR
jgi:ElaB/YqjD/DUF883 family membrane-anchored ribosome-binding protein